jgi:F0F1-type ATP synthase membrane subunit c/vacuolar-type H+-ATPase subunit K
VVVASAGAGLAAGVTVSVFCSQAASNVAQAKMQMYFVIVIVEKPTFG